jgi:MFS transporter, ACS family, glucarate transporter
MSIIQQIGSSPFPGALVATAPQALSDRRPAADRDPATPGPNSYVRWTIVVLMALVSCVAYNLRTNMSVAGESMMRDLGLSQVQLGIVLGAFAWGYGIFQFPGGVFGDRLGGRKGLTLVMILWGALTMLVAIVPSAAAVSTLTIIAVLFALRFTMGVVQAPLFPIVGGYVIARWFPPRGWALPNGLTNAGITLGTAATGPLIAWLVQTVGWRMSFAVTGPLAFVMAAVWWWYVRDRPEDHPGITARELASINIGRTDNAAGTGLGHDWKQVLRDRNVLLITASYFCANYVFYFFVNWLYIYLVDVRKFALLEGGFFAAVPWVCAAVGATAGGAVCDRLSKRHGMTFGCRVVSMTGLLAAGAFICAAATATSPYAAVAFLALSLAAEQFTDAAAWAAATMVGGRQSSMACGVMNTGGNVVGGIGALLVPLTARELGWPNALICTALFGLLGAAFWLWIRADEPTADSRPLSPAERTAVVQPIS